METENRAREEIGRCLSESFEMKGLRENRVIHGMTRYNRAIDRWIFAGMIKSDTPADEQRRALQGGIDGSHLHPRP